MTLPTLADVERAHIRAVLTHTNGRVCETARILDIDRSTLRRKLKGYPGLLAAVRHYQETPPVVQEVDV